MEELKKQYAEKVKEFEEKFADIINEVATFHEVDTGVAFNMIMTSCVRGGSYLDELDIEDELFDQMQSECYELVELSLAIAKA